MALDSANDRTKRRRKPLGGLVTALGSTPPTQTATLTLTPTPTLAFPGSRRSGDATKVTYLMSQESTGQDEQSDTGQDIRYHDFKD